MKSYKEITNRYMKKNIKRTLLTIFGVILSVALITAVGLFLKSFQNSLVENTIKSKGSFHVKVSGMSDKDYHDLENNPKIEKIGVSQTWFECDVKGGKKIKVNKFNKDSMELLPDSYKASKGRLPESDNEIAIENWVLSYMDSSPKIGDTIKLKTSKGETKDFKLTGIIPNQGDTQYSGMALGMTYSDKFDMSKSTVYLTIHKKANISSTVSELSKKFKGHCALNKELLDYSGEGSNELNKQLYLVASIIIGIIVLATIAVIYNSFQISVIERMKQFGLLRAIGTTPRQIRKIVLREASIISAAGIPLGLLSGIFAMFVVSKIFSIMSGSTFGNLKIIIPYYVLIISAVVGIVSIYISAFIPARAASRISPLAAISSRTLIQKEKISKKRGGVLKRFLSIEGLMAFKNIKRNGKKFRVTVFSMVISIALFIFFTSFINMAQVSIGSTSENEKMNFIITGIIDKSGDSSLKDNLIGKIRKDSLVDKEYLSYGTYSSNMLIPDEKKNGHVAKGAPKLYTPVDFENQKMNLMDASFDIYDKDKLESIKSYIKSGKIDIDKMEDENGVILVKNNTIVLNKEYYTGPITNLKVGDSFYVDKNMEYKAVEREDYVKEGSKNTKNFQKDNMVKVKVLAMVDDPPYMFCADNLQAPHIIMTKGVMKNITGKDTGNLPVKMAQIRLKDKKHEDKFNNFLQPLCDANGVKLIDITKQSESGMKSMLQIMVLMYGFIVVISLIGAVNIINTITTNLILRKKEIASLSAIGMTYKNIRHMILCEGVLYGLYGALYGGIVGSLLSYVLSSPMRKIMDFQWNIPWKLILISGLAAIFIGLVSVIRPLYKIKKENIIDVIRQED